MKKVVNAQTVVHYFANQTQNEARTPNSNLYFNDDTLYSYGSHFAIAKHVNNAVLFTTRTYSVTTAKQIRYAKSALNHKTLIYCHNPAASINDNFNSFLKEAENCHGLVTSAKQQRSKIKAFSELAYINDKTNKFAAFFDIDIQSNYPKLYSALNLDIEGITEYRVKAAKLDEAQKLAAQKREAAKHKEQLKKWRSGEINTLYIRDGFDYLRVQGENIRTSQGVEISKEAAKLLYNNLNTSIVGKKVDHKYEITELNDKFLTVGCHKITIKEIKKLATSLNW